MGYNTSASNGFVNGYIPGSEWQFQNATVFVGAFAANTNLTAKAATAGRKNVVTDFLISTFAGANAWVPFLFVVDGTTLGALNANVRWFYQQGLAINTGDNYDKTFHPSNPIIMTTNTATGFFCSSGGVAGCAAEVIMRGYQIVG